MAESGVHKHVREQLPDFKTLAERQQCKPFMDEDINGIVSDSEISQEQNHEKYSDIRDKQGFDYRRKKAESAKEAWPTVTVVLALVKWHFFPCFSYYAI
jgi:hypothetical protein